MLVCMSYIVLCQLWILIFLCDFGSWEMFWLNSTKDTKAYIYLHHGRGRAQTFTFCSASCVLHPPSTKWVSAVGEQPSVMQQKISSPGSNAKSDRKGKHNIFMLKATIHKGLWIEGNLSSHSKGPFCRRRYCKNSGGSNFITWAIVHSVWRI